MCLFYSLLNYLSTYDMMCNIPLNTTTYSEFTYYIMNSMLRFSREKKTTNPLHPTNFVHTISVHTLLPSCFSSRSFSLRSARVAFSTQLMLSRRPTNCSSHSENTFLRSRTCHVAITKHHSAREHRINNTANNYRTIPHLQYRIRRCANNF